MLTCGVLKLKGKAGVSLWAQEVRNLIFKKATTCSHLPVPLRGCERLRVAASGCKWLLVAACGCLWLLVAAGKVAACSCGASGGKWHEVT